MTIYTNSGLVMSMQSAIAAPKTITGATNADPGVFTSVAHGYNDGDLILLEVEGMPTLNKRVFQVYAKATDTFQLEDIDGASGIDTILLGTFSSGTAKKLTMGTSITGVQEFSSSGGDPKFLDTTTVNDLSDKQTINGFTSQSYSMTIQWDPAAAGQIAMNAAFLLQSARAFKVQWPSGRYMLFYGTVGYNMVPGGPSQGVTVAPAAITFEGPPTYGV
jgi:hypothetical protein